MKLLPALCLTACAALLSPCAQAADLLVRLRASAEVSAAGAVLGEVAQVQGEDAALVHEASAVPVMRDLRAGTRQQASRAQLLRLIEAHVPRARGRVEMDGSEQVIVSRAAVPLQAEALVEVAKRYLYETYAGGFEDFSASAVGRPPSMNVPVDHVLARPHLATGGELARRTSVWVDIETPEGLYQSVPVWFEVRAEKRVPVLDSGARKGEPLSGASMQMRKRDVMALDGRPVQAQAVTQGLVAARGIAPGEALTERSAARPAAVLRGQDLLVRMRAGEVVLEYTCKAPNDAQVGQTIRVTNPGSRESFWVRIVGPGMAEAI